MTTEHVSRSHSMKVGTTMACVWGVVVAVLHGTDIVRTKKTSNGHRVGAKERQTRGNTGSHYCWPWVATRSHRGHLFAGTKETVPRRPTGNDGQMQECGSKIQGGSH